MKPPIVIALALLALPCTAAPHQAKPAKMTQQQMWDKLEGKSDRAAVDRRFTLAQRHQIVGQLAAAEDHARRDVGPAVGQSAAKMQVELETKYHAQVCRKWHITYDQMTALMAEAADGNWPEGK